MSLDNDVWRYGGSSEMVIEKMAEDTGTDHVINLVDDKGNHIQTIVVREVVKPDQIINVIVTKEVKPDRIINVIVTKEN